MLFLANPKNSSLKKRSNVLRHMKQKFVLARTNAREITLEGLTDSEKKVVKKVEWFNLEQIRNCDDIIYPVGIEDHLAPIINREIPEQPIEIILDRKPTKKAP